MRWLGSAVRYLIGNVKDVAERTSHVWVRRGLSRDEKCAASAYYQLMDPPEISDLRTRNGFIFSQLLPLRKK